MELTINNHICQQPDTFLSYLKTITPSNLDNPSSDLNFPIKFKVEFEVENVATIIYDLNGLYLWIRNSELEQWLYNINYEQIQKATKLEISYDDQLSFDKIGSQIFYIVTATFKFD